MADVSFDRAKSEFQGVVDAAKREGKLTISTPSEISFCFDLVGERQGQCWA
jgi:hypothetical protein